MASAAASTRQYPCLRHVLEFLYAVKIAEMSRPAATPVVFAARQLDLCTQHRFEALKYSGEARNTSNQRMVSEFEQHLTTAEKAREGLGTCWEPRRTLGHYGGLGPPDNGAATVRLASPP